MQFIDKYRFVLIVVLLFGLFLLISLGNKVKHNMVEHDLRHHMESDILTPDSHKLAEPLKTHGEIKSADTLTSKILDLSKKKEFIVVVY